MFRKIMFQVFKWIRWAVFFTTQPPEISKYRRLSLLYNNAITLPSSGKSRHCSFNRGILIWLSLDGDQYFTDAPACVLWQVG